jgi:hypothetical protein
MQGRPGKTNAGTEWTSSCSSREKDSSRSRVRNGYGRCAATSSLAVFGTLVRRYRERDGLRVWTGARHDAYASRLACSGRAWHSASGSGGQVVVVERLAGWQASVGVEMPLRIAHGGNATNVWTWSEREEPGQSCATEHPQSKKKE